MRILISHAQEDSAIAKLISNLLQHSTSDRITAWFSSDDSAQGGISPGSYWYDRLKQELGETNCIIALVTPNSVAAPWLYFETGFGAADASKKIVPVCLGVKVEAVGMPLSGYQMYNLGSKLNFASFVTKIFNEANVVLREDVHGGPRDKCYEALVEAERKLFAIGQVEKTESTDSQLAAHLASLTQKVDRGFAELARQIPGSQTQYFKDFEIDFVLRSSMGTHIRNFSISVIEGMLIRDVLDDIYFKISKHVEPYMYLESWVVTDEITGLRLVMHEILLKLEAHLVFTRGTRFFVDLLSEPYEPRKDKRHLNYI